MWMGHWCNEGHSWQKEWSGFVTLPCEFFLFTIKNIMFYIEWLYYDKICFWFLSFYNLISMGLKSNTLVLQI